MPETLPFSLKNLPDAVILNSPMGDSFKDAVARMRRQRENIRISVSDVINCYIGYTLSVGFHSTIPLDLTLYAVLPEFEDLPSDDRRAINDLFSAFNEMRAIGELIYIEHLQALQNKPFKDTAQPKESPRQKDISFDQAVEVLYVTGEALIDMRNKNKGWTKEMEEALQAFLRKEPVGQTVSFTDVLGLPEFKDINLDIKFLLRNHISAVNVMRLNGKGAS